MAGLVYTATKTGSLFMKSMAFFRLIAGPVGSGKSVVCCIEILRKCMEMPPGKDGKRRSRWAVIRSTRQQLKDTTLRTFMDWIRPGELGYWKESESTFFLKFGDVEAEILFRPLESPDDVKRVLSLELTGAFINECKNTPKEIVEAIQGRIGRYPRRQDVPDYWMGLIADTNMPEEDTYWHKVMEHLPTEEGNENSIVQCDVFRQPSGLADNAENVENLPEGYYDRLAIGKSKGWIDVYVHGEYGVSHEGKAVYADSFQQDLHLSKTPLHIDDSLPLVIGMDFGRTPAAVIKQVLYDGRVNVLREVVTFGMGMDKFLKYHLKPLLKREFPDHELEICGDPSGIRKNDTDDGNCFKVLRDTFGRKCVKPARSNDPDVRIAATEKLLLDFPMGKPMMVIDPSCKWYSQAFKSKYFYKREKTVDGEFKEKPSKNNWSHVMEAGQYADMHITGGRYGLLASSTWNQPSEAFPAKVRQPADKYAGY